MILLTVEVRAEHHVVLARQRARQVAASLGFAPTDQTSLATAVSELCRNALQYAGGGRVRFSLEEGTVPMLKVVVSDHGPGISNLQEILDGRYVSRTGMGVGLLGARRLTDAFEIRTTSKGTEVMIGKRIPALPGQRLRDLPARIATDIARAGSAGPLDELECQNQELLRALTEVRERQAEVERLNATLEQKNRELEETNQGIRTLYTELEQRAGSLTEIAELKSRVVAQVSHELRTPLGSLLRLSQLLLDRADGDLTPEQEHQVNLMRTSVRTLLQIANESLDFSRLASGRPAVHPETFTVDELFASLRGLFRPIIGSGPPSLTLEAVEPLPRLHTDQNKVAQILRNLISNAIKFTPEGEIRVTALPGPEETLLFSIADTGIGIAPDVQEHIFREYAQVDSPLQRRVWGSGLGLPLSRNLATLLGGTLQVLSSPSGGSTFTLTLPCNYQDPSNRV